MREPILTAIQQYADSPKTHSFLSVPADLPTVMDLLVLVQGPGRRPVMPHRSSLKYAAVYLPKVEATLLIQICTRTRTGVSCTSGYGVRGD